MWTFTKPCFTEPSSSVNLFVLRQVAGLTFFILAYDWTDLCFVLKYRIHTGLSVHIFIHLLQTFFFLSSLLQTFFFLSSILSLFVCLSIFLLFYPPLAFLICQFLRVLRQSTIIIFFSHNHHVNSGFLVFVCWMQHNNNLFGDSFDYKDVKKLTLHINR